MVFVYEGEKIKMMIKWITGILLSTLLLSQMTGCSLRSQEYTAVTKLAKENLSPTTAQPSYLEDTTPITLDWYINFSWFKNKWGGDITSKYITDKTGVSINFIVPEGNEAEKINAMIQLDDLPDILTLGWWEEPVEALINEGLVYAIDELANQYDPYFFTVADQERLRWHTQEDGHVYGYPNASYSPKDYATYELPSNQTFMVRKDIYEAIGSPDMRTPEGFLAGLRAAAHRFPTINGQSLIPIGMEHFGDQGCVSLEDYLQNFLAIPMQDAKGNLYDRDTDPEYIKWLKVFRQANEEGLISMDVFIDGRPQMEEKIAQGRYFALIFQRSDMVAQNAQRYQQDPKSVYIAVDGPANEALDPPTLEGGGIMGWTITMISKSCKDPERAIKFISYMMSEEGQKDFYLGKKNETYQLRAGTPELLPKVKTLLSEDRTAFDKKYGAAYTYWMLMDNAMSKKWEEKLTEPFAQPYNWTLGKVVDNSAYSDLSIGDPELNQEISKIQLKWGETLPLLIQADSEETFDGLMQEYMNYRRAHSYRSIQFYQQKKFEENKERLGIR